MKKLSNLTKATTHRAIIFGLPKSGKSQLAGELAEYFDLIWVDMENGHEVLFKMPQEWQERITLVDLPDTRSYPIAIETCLKMVKGPVSICDKHGKVGCMICKKELTTQIKAECESKEYAKDPSGNSRITDAEKEAIERMLEEDYFTDLNLPALDHNTVVVFDSLTQLTNSAIAHITKNEPDTYKLDYDDWGNLGKLLDIFLSHIQQSGYNCVVISHEAEVQTEGGKNMLVPVGGTRNFSRNVAKYFDHVIYAERKNKKHVFTSSTTASTTILTGSRSDVALETSDKASLLQIFKPELYSGGSSSNAEVAVPKITKTAGVKTASAKTRVTKSAAEPVVVESAKNKAADILARLKDKKGDK